MGRCRGSASSSPSASPSSTPRHLPMPAPPNGPLRPRPPRRRVRRSVSGTSSRTSGGSTSRPSCATPCARRRAASTSTPRVRVRSAPACTDRMTRQHRRAGSTTWSMARSSSCIAARTETAAARTPARRPSASSTPPSPRVRSATCRPAWWARLRPVRSDGLALCGARVGRRPTRWTPSTLPGSAFFAQQGERSNPEPYPGCVKPTPTPEPTGHGSNRYADRGALRQPVARRELSEDRRSSRGR